RNLYDPEQGGFFMPEGWSQWQGNTSDTAGMNQFLDDNGYRANFIPGDRYDPYGLYFAPGYMRRVYQKYHAIYFNPKVNIVSQLNENHQIKAGFEYRYHSIRYYENLEANRGINANILNSYGYTLDGQENDNGNGGLLDGVRHPYDIALYAQDKIEDEGLVVNAGIRFDFFNANTKSLKDEQDPLGANQVPSGDPRATRADATDFSDTKTEQQISPRLGIAFPVTDKTVFHFNYGKFFQQPSLTDLYYGTKLIEFKARSGSPTYATQNPNLRPEQTTSYEVGITQELAENVRFSGTAYYKDTKDLVNLRYTATSAPGGAALYLLTNQDYGTIKGIDLNLDIRRMGPVSGRFAYSLAFAQGTGSASRENFNAVWLGYNTAKFTQPLGFDQRHTISANVDIRNEGGDGSNFLDRTGANILMTARSGFPYTPVEKYPSAPATISQSVPRDAPLDAVNSRYGPWTLRIDLKIDKEIDMGPFSTNFYLRILNLLNTENLLAVYQATGDANNDGFLGTEDAQDIMNIYETDTKSYTTGSDYANKYNDRLAGADVNSNGNNVRKYDSPREVRLGMIITF
ncbi:MAG: TonB-dependent receptor, partial [Bacteroidetes bacterium]